ncbi:MAG TPA: AraC family transcriptional regulator [Pseudoxanthomonas sp.]|nr:AraC family transcriptional regulator [Pseudoxanthomonas sp.]
MPSIVQHRLRMFAQLDLHHETADALHVVLAQGRGSRVLVPPHWMSLCWPIRGRVWQKSGGMEWAVDAGRCQLWGGGELACRAADAQGWLLIAGARGSWPHASLRHTAEAPLLPWQGRMTRELARPMITAARHRDGSTAATAREGGAALMEGISRRQADLHDLLERCAGRTRHLRHQTMTRLLRVRHAIVCDPGQRQDLDRLATLANYSPCHLLRMHRRVFGETPFEYASRLRDRRALELIQGTELSILDVSLRLGFESQSAFCRAFKLSFGATPTEVRRHALQRAQQAA